MKLPPEVAWQVRRRLWASFTDADGQKPLSDNAVWKLVLRRARAAGITEHVTSHSTRSSRWRWTGGAPLHKVQATAGHADPRTT